MAKKCILAVIALVLFTSIFSGCAARDSSCHEAQNLSERVIQQKMPYTAIVFHDGNNVWAMNSSGQIFAGTQRGQSVTDVFQQAVDLCKSGGEVRIKAGKYRLDKSIVVDYPCTISGEGRGTVLVPPANEFALLVKRTDRSPVLSDWVWGTKKEQIPTWLDELCAKRLYDVQVRSLAIIGYGHGKGIYLNELTECSFADLWIHVTNDGSALYINSTVMESEFQNIHCYNNGSIENKEATIVIASQDKGDSSNNLHFDKVYVLLPDYIGVEIGTDTGKYHPRLIYFSHSFFHGWYPEQFLAPYDLIYIHYGDRQRGVTITDSRFTLPAKSKSLVHLGENTLAQISNCSFGVVSGEKGLIRADSNSIVIVTNNSFHFSSKSDSIAISAEKASTIIENNVFFAEPNSIRIELPKSSILQGNLFSK